MPWSGISFQKVDERAGVDAETALSVGLAHRHTGRKGIFRIHACYQQLIGSERQQEIVEHGYGIFAVDYLTHSRSGIMERFAGDVEFHIYVSFDYSGYIIEQIYEILRIFQN